MQLFISEYTKKESTITITNLDILSQVRKVLRAKIGDIIWIQNSKNESKKIRYEIQIKNWNDKELQWKILSEHIHELNSKKTTIIVAMPNKWDKAELIAQKLSEIGISEIIFWPSERSIIKVWNQKKEERLNKIIKEAIEQSRWRNIPKILFTTTIDEHLKDTEVIIFDKYETNFKQAEPWKHIVWIIWPEGGLTEKDYKIFSAYTPKIVGLGKTVLRMETAAIVGGRVLQNNTK